MTLFKFPRRLLAAATVAALYVIPQHAMAQQPPAAEAPQKTRYICTALERAGGHEEPSLTSPPMRMDDGRLRILENDEKAYASWTGENVPGWLALYNSENGSSDAFLGHFPSDAFKCQAILGQ